MDSSHESLLNAEGIVDDLSQWGQAIGCARCVGDYFEVLVVLGLIHAHNEHGSVGGWGRNDDLLGTTSKMLGCGFYGKENTGGLYDVISAVGAPWNFIGVLLGIYSDQRIVDLELAICHPDLSLELAVDGVMLKHVNHVLQINEGIIDSHQCNISALGDDRASDETTNAPEPVDANLDGHFFKSVAKNERWRMRDGQESSS
mmetsp:Transcript_12562/g.20487  ORF Transcript_12562/g.20487 Transcript_12562/m.20487 type:complete len:201 (-) Transcript_12562:80-682(-)